MIDAVRRMPLVEIAVLVASIAILATIGVLNHERKAQTATNWYSTSDATGGGYRAWYELLEREGLPVVRFEQPFADLDAGIGTLVIADVPSAFGPPARSRADAAALADWVRGGGTAIVVGNGPNARTLASELPLPPVVAKPARNGAPFVAARFARAGIRRVDANGARLRPAVPARVLLGDARGAIVVERALGRGQLVAVCDPNLFVNGEIAAFDRARLAVALVADGRPGAIAFDETIHGFALAEHWWQATPPRLVAAIGLAGAAVLAALAGAAVRFGPALAPPPPPEPNSEEFLTSLAALYERARAREKAMRDLVAGARRRLAKAVAIDANLSDRDLVAALPQMRARAAFVRAVDLAQAPEPTDSALLDVARIVVQLRKDRP